MSDQQNPTVTIFGIIAAVIVIVLGVVTFSLSNNKSKTNSLGSAGDWLTYTNDPDSYTIQYPGDWVVNSNGVRDGVLYLLTNERNQKLLANKNQGGLRFFDVMVRVYRSADRLPGNDTTKLSFTDWVDKKATDYDLPKKSTLSIAGVTGYQWTGSKLGNLVIMFEKNGRIYRLETGEIPTLEDQKIIDRFSLTVR